MNLQEKLKIKLKELDAARAKIAELDEQRQKLLQAAAT